MVIDDHCGLITTATSSIVFVVVVRLKYKLRMKFDLGQSTDDDDYASKKAAVEKNRWIKMIKTQYVITVIFTGARKFEKVLAKNILS